MTGNTITLQTCCLAADNQAVKRLEPSFDASPLSFVSVSLVLAFHIGRKKVS